LFRAFKTKNRRTEEGLNFIEDLLLKNPNVDATNKSGVCVRTLLLDRGTDKIKELLNDYKSGIPCD